MRIEPLQLFEKVLTPANQLTTYFQIWFRNLSQYIKDSQTIVSISASNDSYDYCMIGNIFVINYSGTNGMEINLPNKIAENQIITFWEGDVIKKLEISKNSMKIVVPNGNIKFTSTLMLRV